MNITPFIEAGPAIQIHMLAALAALFLGAFVLLRRKGGAAHKRNGKLWVWLMMITSLSGFFIHEIRVWGDYSPIHIISALVPAGLVLAVIAARRGDIARHRNIMKGTYVGGMLIAGGFTFLPGRLNHEIFLSDGLLTDFPVLHWSFALVAAALVGTFFLWRGLRDKPQN